MQPHDFSGLGTGSHLHLDFLLERRDLDFASQCRLDKGYGGFANDILTFALEQRMLFDRHHHEQVSGRSPLGTGFPFAAEFQSVSGFYPGGNFQRNGLLPFDASGSTTLRTGGFDDFPLSGTIGAGPCQRKKALLVTNLAGTTTGRAGLGGGAFFCPATVAGFAGLVFP